MPSFSRFASLRDFFCLHSASGLTGSTLPATGFQKSGDQFVMRKCFKSVIKGSVGGFGIGVGSGMGGRIGVGLVLASLASAVAPGAFGQYASGVVSYTPGTGAAAGFDQAV